MGTRIGGGEAGQSTPRVQVERRVVPDCCPGGEARVPRGRPGQAELLQVIDDDRGGEVQGLLRRVEMGAEDDGGDGRVQVVFRGGDGVAAVLEPVAETLSHLLEAGAVDVATGTNDGEVIPRHVGRDTPGEPKCISARRA